ncbi:FprA family A-type flavoprotein [Ectothiorhodospiraceae bacterium 2226]|nr:FprA family A-type flavoprotein [Ectothiorhodospiraceae bacterium 2226]
MITLFDQGGHKCVAFEDLVTCGKPGASGRDACDSIQSNQFLIVDDGHAALLDPGGNLTYNRLFMQASNHVVIKNLDYVIASHQDPDIVASLNKWLVGTDCQVIVPEIWKRFIPHFCSPGATEGRLIGIPDAGAEIKLGRATLVALPAHFLHSEGNFHFYDPQSRILFSGDVGASSVDPEELSAPVRDMATHIPRMLGFHRRYMNSNRVCRLWVNMVRDLDVDWIVPQHGPSFRGREMVGRFLDWFEHLECGVDLMTQEHYRRPRAALGRPAAA